MVDSDKYTQIPLRKETANALRVEKTKLGDTWDEFVSRLWENADVEDAVVVGRASDAGE